jgi:hypothetical protein
MRTALVVFCVVVVGAVSAADEKPDFTVTAEEFAKEFNADSAAFERKYVGKTVEVTGSVRARTAHLLRVVLFGAKKKPTDAVDIGVSCEVPAKLDEQLRGLAREQQLTVRGKCVRANYPKLTECEFVKVGPSPALPMTVSGLVGEFKKDFRVARKAYDNKAVVARVEVLAAKNANGELRWTVADAGAKDGAKIEARVGSLIDGAFENKKFMAELEKVKPGDVVILSGYLAAEYDPLLLTYAVVLKEPPAGVKLPGDKK